MGNRLSQKISNSDHPRLNATRESAPNPVLPKKKSRFSKFKRSKTKNISLSLDTTKRYSEPKLPDDFVNGFTPKITAVGIQNGLLRMKLERIDMYIKRVMRYMEFHLKYKIISDTKCCTTTTQDQWEEIFFNHLHIGKMPASHFCIRLRSCLSAYKIQLQLTLRSRKTLSQRRIEIPLLAKNIWCPWSDILEVNVPSIMQHNTKFMKGDWIKYKVRHMNKSQEDKWSHGIIDGISPLQHVFEDKIAYEIIDFQTQKIELCQEVKRYVSANYIDISHAIDADIMLLFGDRMGVDTQNIEDVYSQMYDSFYTQYARKIYKKRKLRNVVLVSMAKCVSFNVMDFLCMNKEKAYKMHCFMNVINDKNENTSHFDSALKLMPSRAYQINKCRMSKDFNEMDYWFYCDNCLCRQGVYGWMFRCQFNENNDSCGHELCLTCIHDMIGGRDELMCLLQDVLTNVISSDCIQIISCYVIGCMNKHSH